MDICTTNIQSIFEFAEFWKHLRRVLHFRASFVRLIFIGWFTGGCRTTWAWQDNGGQQPRLVIILFGRCHQLAGAVALCIAGGQGEWIEAQATDP